VQVLCHGGIALWESDATLPYASCLCTYMSSVHAYVATYPVACTQVPTYISRYVPRSSSPVTHIPATPCLTGPDVPIGCPGAPPAHLCCPPFPPVPCALCPVPTPHSPRCHRLPCLPACLPCNWPGSKRDWTRDPDPLPCFLPRLQGASGQSDVSASSTQNEPQTLACPPCCASSNDTCSAPPKHRRLDVGQLYPPSPHIPSFDSSPVRSCQLSQRRVVSPSPTPAWPTLWVVIVVLAVVVDVAAPPLCV
jgi:hypothetical protein